MAGLIIHLKCVTQKEKRQSATTLPSNQVALNHSAMNGTETGVNVAKVEQE